MNEKTNEQDTNQFLASSKFKLAIVILIFYLAFIAYLIFNIGIKENHWGRFLFLFSGIEAIVFAAVGYVFGRDVSRRSEVIAEKDAKNAKREKDEAQKEKEKTTKEKQIIKENLIRLQEAVLSENNSQLNFGGNRNNPVKASGVKSTGFLSKNLFNSRALDLVIKQQKSFAQSPIVSFNFKVEVDDFQSVTVDGKTKYSSEGYFRSVYTFGKTIDVSVDRDNFKTWKFTAFDITDEDGREMVMSNSPLETNGNKSSFYIEYK